MRLTVCAGLLLISAMAGAEPLADLKHFYRDVVSLSADFEQRLIDEDGETLERFAGRVWMQRPGRFLWKYDTPYPLELGADGTVLWHYDADLRQITLRDARTSLSGTPAELLGGDLSGLEAYTLERQADADGLEWLRLLPRKPDSDFAQIRIGLAAGEPRLISLADRLGQTTVMELHDLRRNPELAPARFELTIPAGVTVVDDRPAP